MLTMSNLTSEQDYHECDARKLPHHLKIRETYFALTYINQTANLPIPSHSFPHLNNHLEFIN